MISKNKVQENKNKYLQIYIFYRNCIVIVFIINGKRNKNNKREKLPYE